MQSHGGGAQTPATRASSPFLCQTKLVFDDLVFGGEQAWAAAAAAGYVAMMVSACHQHRRALSASANPIPSPQNLLV